MHLSASKNVLRLKQKMLHLHLGGRMMGQKINLHSPIHRFLYVMITFSVLKLIICHAIIQIAKYFY